MKVRKIFDNTVKYVTTFADKIYKTHVFAYASQATLFVIISAVPFLMLVLNVIQALLPFQPADLKGMIDTLFPVQIREMAYRIVEDFYDVNVPLISVTSVFLVWSASRGVRAISAGLKIVFDSQDSRGIILSTIWSLIYTALFMISLVASAAALLFGKYLAQIIVKYIPSLESLINIILNSRYLILYVFLTLVFMGGYKYLGRSKISFHRQFVGAALAAGTWLLFSYFYSLYIANISNMSYIYGSLTAVIFLMLWLWFCMIFLLFGAVVNRWLYEHDLSVILIIKSVFSKRKKIKKHN
ncbi:MAG: YihY/virulence factor BrkB family protein [Acutalibacteraceae bacterium]|nr:YihY/virulence factor BrkB family protein [Acutalibacteraceae bacterium]